MKDAPLIMFDKKVSISRDLIDWGKVASLAHKLSCDDEFDVQRYLTLPNASEQAIKKLHLAHIEKRRKGVK